MTLVVYKKVGLSGDVFNVGGVQVDFVNNDLLLTLKHEDGNVMLNCPLRRIELTPEIQKKFLDIVYEELAKKGATIV